MPTPRVESILARTEVFTIGLFRFVLGKQLEGRVVRVEKQSSFFFLVLAFVSWRPGREAAILVRRTSSEGSGYEWFRIECAAANKGILALLQDWVSETQDRNGEVSNVADFYC